MFIWQTRPQVECGAPNLALGMLYSYSCQT